MFTLFFSLILFVVLYRYSAYTDKNILPENTFVLYISNNTRFHDLNDLCVIIYSSNETQQLVLVTAYEYIMTSVQDFTMSQALDPTFVVNPISKIGCKQIIE